MEVEECGCLFMILLAIVFAVGFTIEANTIHTGTVKYHYDVSNVGRHSTRTRRCIILESGRWYMAKPTKEGYHHYEPWKGEHIKLYHKYGVFGSSLETWEYTDGSGSKPIPPCDKCGSIENRNMVDKGIILCGECYKKYTNEQHKVGIQ